MFCNNVKSIIILIVIINFIIDCFARVTSSALDDNNTIAAIDMILNVRMFVCMGRVVIVIPKTEVLCLIYVIQFAQASEPQPQGCIICV